MSPKFKRTLAVDENGDILTDDQGKAVWYNGPRGVKQELKVTLATIRGEQPFAEDFGLDVFEIAGESPAILQREVRRALLPDDRVAGVPSVQVDVNPEKRTAEVTATVELVTEDTVELTQEVTQ